MKRKADAQEFNPRKKQKIVLYDENSFSSLPNELVFQILSYLKEQELRWIRLINQQLFNIVNMSHFNIGVVLDAEMSELIRVFGRYNKPIGLTFRKTNKLSDVSCLTQLTQLTSLDIGCLNSPALNVNNKLTNLQSLTAHVSLTELRAHSLLTKLVIKHEEGEVPIPGKKALSSKRYEQCLKAMPNIKHLELFDPARRLQSGIKCHLTGLETLSVNFAITDLPVNTLTSLTIEVSEIDKDQNVYWDIAHLTNLRHLKVLGDEFINQLSVTPFTSLESLSLPAEPRTDYFNGERSDSHLTQLISSKITRLDVVISAWKNIARVASMSNLQQLKLDTFNGGSIDFSPLSCLTHLTSLNIGALLSHNLMACTTLHNLLELELESSNEDSGMVFTSFTLLTRLSLMTNRDAVNVSHMTSLQSLSLKNSENPIGLSALSGLTSFEGYYFDFESCSALHSLQLLSTSRKVSDENIDVLSCLTRLTSFEARVVSGEHLTRLTRLHHLDVSAELGTSDIRESIEDKLIYCCTLNCINHPYY